MPSNDDPGAFAVGQIRSVEMGPGIVEYLERIESTLEPFGGRYVVHGSRADVREGSCDGDLVVIGFPDRDHAERWYLSDAYRVIRPLRSEHSDSTVVIVDAVGPGHRATDVLAAR